MMPGQDICVECGLPADHGLYCPEHRAIDDAIAAMAVRNEPGEAAAMGDECGCGDCVKEPSHD